MSFLIRSRRHLSVLAALAVVVGLVAGSWMVALGALSRAADEGVRLGLESRSGADLALRATGPLGSDPAAQDEAVRAAIDDGFGGLRAAFELVRTASASASVVAPSAPDSTRAGLVMQIDDLAEHALLVEGAWPASADEVAVQADAALVLGAAVGDTLTLDGAPYRLAAVWRVADPLDPRWLGDPQLLAGRDDAGPSALGPVVVDPTRLSGFAEPQAQWTLVPDASRVTAADLQMIAAAWSRVPSSWRGVVDDAGAFRKSGRLGATIAELDARVDGLRAIEPVVLLVLGAAAVVAALELGRLLAGNRAREIALLWARGRGAGETGLRAGAEAAVGAALGAVVGLGLGAAVLALLGDEVGLDPATLVVAGAAVLVAAAACGVAAWRQAGEGVHAEAAEGRLRRAAGPAATVVALAAAAVSVWQLRLYGSPVTPLADGTSAVDPVAVGAPALAVVAGALVALTAFPLVARTVARAGADASVPRLLAGHTVARRLRRVAAPLLVIAIAASTVLVSAGYLATWSVAFDRTSALRAGAELSVTHAGGFDESTIGRVEGVEGVAALAPVRRDELVLSDASGTLVAIAPDALARLASDAVGALDPAAVAEGVAAELPGPRIPPTARELVLAASLTGFTRPPTVRVTYADGWGRVAELRAEAPDAEGSVGLRLPLPASASQAEGRVLAVDVEVPAASVAEGARAIFSLDEFATDAGPLPDGIGAPTWSALATSPGGSVGTAGPRAFSVERGGVVVRLTPDPAGGTPPVAISRGLADRHGLDVGSMLRVQSAGSYASTDMRVTAVLPAVPGADDTLAVLIDLGVLQYAAARDASGSSAPDTLWLDTAAIPPSAAALREVLPPGARILTAHDTAGRAVLGSAATALTGVAALCVLLALITLAAVARAEHRVRIGDLAVLRALGFRSRQQASLRRTELWIVAAYALIAGAVVGGVVVALTVPQLASAAVPDPVPGLDPAIRIDPAVAAGGGVLLVGTLALLIELAAAGVRRASVAALTAGDGR